MKRIWRKIRNYFKALLAADTGRRGADDSSTPAASGTVPDGGTGSTAATADGVDFPLLDWCYGGFRGGGAVLADAPRIKSLMVSRIGMSYAWERGGCEDMGASGPHDAACIAALFCRVGTKWRGGKFDWISTDRHTRGFTNIMEGYGGWSQETFRDADAFAFVIVSRNGRHRTNVIVQEGRI